MLILSRYAAGMMRFITWFGLLSYCALIAWGANAQSVKPMFSQGDWLLRSRVVVIDPATSGEVIPIGGKPYISTSVIPEIDLSYFLTDNIAVEFVPGLIPQKAKAKGTALGDRDAGRIYAVAPTLMLQYHREVTQGVKPYVGLGMAYVKYFEDDTVDQLQYDDDIAAIVQAGLDVKLSENWVANADVKKAWAGTEAKINRGAAKAIVNIDPIIYGVGLGYKF